MKRMWTVWLALLIAGTTFAGVPFSKLGWTDKQQFVSTNGTVQWQLFVPAVTNPAPLVIWLHGGANSTGEPDLETPKPFVTNEAIARHPCYVLVPCAIVGQNWASEKGKKIIKSSGYSSRPTASVRTVKDLLDSLLDSGAIDRNRVYIGGASGGGYGTWAFIQFYPRVFAAAYPIASNGRLDLMDGTRDVRIWMFHGKMDSMVPWKYAYRMLLAAMISRGQGSAIGETDWDLLYEADKDLRLTVDLDGRHISDYGTIFGAPDFMDWLFDSRRIVR